MFKVNNKKHQSKVVNNVVLVSLLLTLNIFPPFFIFSVVNFEQIFAAKELETRSIKINSMIKL